MKNKKKKKKKKQNQDYDNVMGINKMKKFFSISIWLNGQFSMIENFTLNDKTPLNVCVIVKQ